MKKSLIIDTDMGNDDILAIAILLSSGPQITAFSLVNGVSRLSYAANNLQSLLSYLNLKIPIYMDAQLRSGPNKINFPKQDQKRAEKLTLLNSLELPKSKKAEVLPLKELLKNRSNVTILALGPLTNIAFLLTKDPLIKNKIKKIIIMGGGINKGNIPPLKNAEYNIALDPKSAQIVFGSGIDIELVPIDATKKVPCSKKFQNSISQIKPMGKTSQIIQEIILNNSGDFDAFYDPLAAAILLNPRMVTKKINGEIKVVQSGKNLGQTLINASSGGLSVVLDINKKIFYDFITNSI